jgi:hypothetical protein
MTATIDPKSIAITVTDDGVVPLADIHDSPLLIGTSSFPGFVRFRLKHTPQVPDTQPHSFFATGHAKFVLGPGDTLDDWQVGFVQLDRQTIFEANYIGRTSAEGALQIDPKPKFSSAIALDCAVKASAPWYSTPDEKMSFKNGVASPFWGDGPKVDVPQILGNSAASNFDNYLLSFNRWSEFYTLLSAVAPDKTRQFLGYVYWNVFHGVDFKWKARKIVKQSARSSYRMDKNLRLDVMPSDADVAALLATIQTKPTGLPIANDIFPKEFQNAILGNDPTTRKEMKDWSGLLVPPPSDFWTP